MMPSARRNSQRGRKRVVGPRSESNSQRTAEACVLGMRGDIIKRMRVQSAKCVSRSETWQHRMCSTRQQEHR